MLPEDPSSPFYVGFNSKFKGVSSLSGCLPPLCNSCSNYDYNGQVLRYEPEPFNKPQTTPTQPNREQSGQLQQIHGEVFYLRNQLKEHLSKSSKKTYVIK